MRTLFFVIAMVCFCTLAHTQKKHETKHFTQNEKSEWDAFVVFYSGNGNGTCLPIMQAQIDTGKCMQFNFCVSLYIDKKGKIKKVKVIESKIFCENKTIQQELLECFVQTLKEDFTEFKYLRNTWIQTVWL